MRILLKSVDSGLAQGIRTEIDLPEKILPCVQQCLKVKNGLY